MVPSPQERFFSSKKTSREECWYVPLSFVSAGDKLAAESSTRPPQDWLHCTKAGASAKTVEGMPSKDKWVLFNVNMGGAFRVQYDDRNWELLAAALAEPASRAGIGLVGRAQLIGDAFELAQARRLSYAVPLQFVNSLKLEEDFQPWRVALSALSGIDGLVRDDIRYYLFRVSPPRPPCIQASSTLLTKN